MATQARLVLDNACYHITTRGNQRQSVFRCEEDYAAYIERLKKYKHRFKFALYGYCLMPNHVHLIGEIKQKADLAKFMHALARSYTLYFNKKYNKVGHLWQGRYKSRVIIKDEYLLNCVNYVELNPVRANVVSSPDKYRWSSYVERELSLMKSDRLVDDFTL